MKKKFVLIRTIFLLMFAFILNSNFSSGQTCPSGMTSYWKLQEFSGPVYTDSKGSHNAVVTGSAPTQTQGISGKAQAFDASASTYISVADHSDFDWAGTGSFSIELWVKYTEVGSTRVFIGRDDPTSAMQWWIGSTPTGEVEFYLQSSTSVAGDIVSSSSHNNGQWTHVVAVRDGTAGKNYLYINGAAQSINVSFTGNFSSTGDINIGNLVDNFPQYFFTGGIDEVAIYNRALTSTEITTHYNNVRLYQIGYCDGDNPAFLSMPVTTATVGQQYTYDVDASGNSTPIYSLVEKPTGMDIDQVTGIITWTPASISANGHVVVRATNNKGSVDQTFNIFLADVPDCRNNLIAYWDFNETGNAPYYDNIYGYELTGGSPTPAGGIVGGALSFDGVNDSLNMHDLVEPANVFFDFDNVPSFTWEVWIKTGATPANVMVIIGREQYDPDTLYDNSTQYWLGITTEGKVGFYLRDWPRHNPNEAYIEGGNVLDNNWHHLVATYDASSDAMKLYVDKILVDETTQSFLNFGGNDDLNIGCLNTTSSLYWYEGVMDELSFYNTALDESRITSDYNDGIAGKGGCTYNYAPLVVSIPDTVVNEDSPYYYKLVSTDINQSDVINISVVNKPAWLNFSYVAADTFAVLSGTPDNSNVGLYDVKLRVSDGKVNVDQAWKLRVKNVNDAPVITSTPITETNEDVAYSYTVVATDVDAGDVLTYSATQKPDWLSFNGTNHKLTGTPTNSDTGTFDIIVRVFDGTVNVDQPFTLHVKNVNDVPVISGQVALTYDEDTPFDVTLSDLTVTDVDNPVTDLTLVLLSGTNYTFDGATVTPTANFNGNLSVNLKVNDLLGSSANFVLHVTITAVNDIPVITSVPITQALEDVPYTYVLVATDPDGDILTKQAVVKPTWLAFSNDTLKGTPSNSNLGDHNVTLRVSDGKAVVEQPFVITVKNVNDPPRFTSVPSQSGDDYEFYSYQVTATDDDGDPLIYSAVTIPQWLTFNPVTRLLSGTPKWDDANKVFDVTLSVTDGIAPVDQSFQISVGNRNDLPVITSIPDTVVSVGSEYFYQFTATDVDEDDNLTFDVVYKPDWLSFFSSALNASLVGTPALANVGSNSVILKVNDGHDDVIQSFKINVKIKSAVNNYQYDLLNSIYPVPAGDIVNFEFAETGNPRIEIYDIAGNLRREAAFEQTKLVKLNVTDLSKGIYVYKIFLNDKVSVGKFTKE